MNHRVYQLDVCECMHMRVSIYVCYKRYVTSMHYVYIYIYVHMRAQRQCSPFLPRELNSGLCWAMTVYTDSEQGRHCRVTSDKLLALNLQPNPRKWNCFDTVVVLLQWADYAAEQMPNHILQGGNLGVLAEHWQRQLPSHPF